MRYISGLCFHLHPTALDHSKVIAMMRGSTLFLIACLLALNSALSIPCSKQQLDSTPCHILGGASSVDEEVTTVADMKTIALGKRGKPFPSHLAEETIGMTLPPPDGPWGLIRGRNSNTFGPYRLAAGTYQIYVQWISYFVPGRSTHHPPVPSVPITSDRSGDEGLHHGLLLLTTSCGPKATIVILPAEPATADLLDIVTCPMTSLNRPIRTHTTVEFSIRISDDYHLPDGSFDQRPSRADAFWRIATQ